MAEMSHPSKRITQQELESYLWGAAVLLRGLIDAGDYKQFIFPLLFYKRVSDVWDEEYQAALADSDGDLSYAEFAENHRFQIPEGAHWNDVRQAPKNVGAAIQKAMRAIETANPDLLDGIFGDAPWTNRERLPDETLKDLIEHFSTQTLSVANVPEDELGNAYEYLIKKFADDSGHTAAEFYTNRTVVHLMTQLLAPQAGESIYDPTCGTGGMLISALDEVKRSGGEYRTLKLYGQERNLITSSIARMNLFLHGVEDFEIIRGDTLAEPKHIEGDRLRQFDVILANPPYSIKQWNREAWSSDKWGRNSLGTPPQGRADYAFQQHILTSLTAKGRCAVLWPHGVLFRNEEQAMRAKMVEQDWVEAIIGLGPNLFYNSPMESCIVICNRKKVAARKGKVIFIDAVNEVTRERAQSFLKPEHQQRILSAYKTFADVPGFAKVATLAEIGANAGNLSIPLYVKRIAAAVATDSNGDAVSLRSAWNQWQTDGRAFWQQMDAVVETLDGLCPTSPVAQIIPMPQKAKSPVQPAFKRAVLAAEIVHQLHREQRFGSVKLEKLLFLSEKHFSLEADMQSHYYRQAAGPYDPKAMRSIVSNLRSHRWFDTSKINGRTQYTPLEKVGQHADYYARYFAHARDGINLLITRLKAASTEQCEIVATLYSAWFDLKAKNEPFVDEDIIREVTHNWHPSKQRIEEARWYRALAWMREHRLTPDNVGDLI
ncbi:class I SAM-dependent DNA methyltransferase [Pigmentiphaga sp. D-2]|uniref:type I restriction-modification system subunit M n=1 Tax=Pigmentiphaga sp. D-2 TaxID=1002116 RepID=UPI001FB74F90|nr:class I SAM-dependent DNA methyltransferase [Pigmentiphaga sp. D-2]